VTLPVCRAPGPTEAQIRYTVVRRFSRAAVFLRVLKRTAIGEVSGDPGNTERVAARFPP
jgi:hypothetical protein